MIVGVDVGGTFTDFVVLRAGRLTVHKALSTPADPAQAVLGGIQTLGVPADCPIAHGSTVATNAVLERKGARTALVTTLGFADVLEIGRQTRPALYDFFVDRVPPLVPAEGRLEVRERVDWQGTVLTPLDPAETRRVARQIAESGWESVAVCLLFSFLRSEHELAIGAAIQRECPDVFVSLSSEVLPEFREYERTSTVVINAYVAPAVARYVARLEAELGPRLRIMQSSGGSMSAAEVCRQPVRTVLSGPAGGVVGAFSMAREAGFDQVITFDMGGTSTDVSLCPGRVLETTEATIGGLPIRTPGIDIHTVGAGGGSIASIDAGGALRVGPESAGAAPGPACYGRGGTRPTVTDANLVLGRLDAHHFLGGRMALDVSQAHRALDELCRPAPRTPGGIGWGGALAAARGVIQVANSNVARAVRVISVERGYDPRDFTLVAFGGAGPLHACELADELGIPRVLVPRHPGVLSAIGMALADVVRDYSRTVMLAEGEATPARLASLFAPLEERGWRDLLAELKTGLGIGQEQVHVVRLLDVRYHGQAYELAVPFEPEAGPNAAGRPAFVEQFHRAHEQRFAYAAPDRPVEIVTLRLKMIGRTGQARLEGIEAGGESPVAALLGEKPVSFGDGGLPAGLYDRARLRAGNRLVGPAVVVQLDSTVGLPPAWTGRVDQFGNLVLERG